MKFSFAVVLAALGFADAKRTHGRKKRTLAKHAVPVNKDGSLRKTARKLDNDWEISAYNSITFNDCITMKTLDEDLQDENLYAMTAAGKLVGVSSFVLFNVGQRGNEYYSSEDNLWMVPLENWLEALGEEGEDMDEQYCNACQESYDVCYPEEDENQNYNQNQNQDDQGDNGDRKLKKKRRVHRELSPKEQAKRDSLKHLWGKQRKLDQYVNEWEWLVDCDQCLQDGCFNEEEEEQEQADGYYCEQDNYYSGSGCVFQDEDLQEFIGKDAFCSETGQVEYINGQEVNIMAGLMCNQYGNGVEMALFLNDECTLYDKSRSFKGSMSGTYTYAALQAASEKIKSPYDGGSIDCMKYEWVAIEEEDENGDYNNNQNNNDEEAPVSEICENLMGEALDLYSCGGAEWEQNDNGNDNNNDGYDMSFYEYDIEDDADADQVCLKLQQDNGEFGGYHVYENSNEFGGGGTFFDYSNNAGSNNGPSPGKIIGIVVAVLVVIVAGVMIGQSFAKKGDSKKVPLVGNKAGAMA